MSPFPFRSWACIVDLKIRIKAGKKLEENIVKILEKLHEYKLNILSLQIIHAGYSHFIMELTVELANLRGDIENIKTENKQEKRSDKLKLVFSHIYIAMKNFTEEVNKLNTKNSILYTTTSDDHFSDDNIFKIADSILGKATNLDKNDFNKCAEDHNLPSIEWRWLTSLALHAFQNNEKRLRFKYEKINLNWLLTFDLDNSDYSDINEVFKNINSTRSDLKPFFVMTSFNLEHKYLRMRPVVSQENNDYLEIKIDYKSRIYERIDNKLQISKFGSRGLTLSIFEQIIKLNPHFKLISSSGEGLQRENQKKEQGTIIVNGFSSEEFGEEKLQCDIEKCFNKRINKEINHDNEPQKTTLELNISKKVPHTIFLSFRQSLLDNDGVIKEVIKSKLKEHGFNVIISETITTGITTHVMNNMEECDACLQIYTLSEAEIYNITNKSSNDFIPDHAWLLFEYGLAMQKKIPIHRMIDTTYLPKENWEKHLRIGKDTFLTEFRGHLFSDTINSHSLINKLDKIAQSLLSDINRNYCSSQLSVSN
ncbi:MAG: hypothetical protein HAW67_08440 [Endozoicomonadaceae bacterium]|nr:hypothetical protein [Endozoicomonadaceae bacterium]